MNIVFAPLGDETDDLLAGWGYRAAFDKRHFGGNLPEILLRIDQRSS